LSAELLINEPTTQLDLATNISRNLTNRELVRNSAAGLAIECDQVSSRGGLVKFCWTLLYVLLIASLAATQDQPLATSNSTFQDELLDHLVGKWTITGTVHGAQSKQTIEAEWVLNHQFLRVYEKSVENVAGTNAPYEGVFFIGYDDTSKRYVAHLMNVFGGRESEGLGYGQRDGNEIKLIFKNSEGSVVSRFIWDPESKTWRILSFPENAKGKVEPILDLTAMPSK
jgi:hypothetical protein